MTGKKAEPYILLLPAVTLALIFSILPFSRSIVLSFLRVTQNGRIIGFAALDNYRNLFSDKAFLQSISHTLLFVALFLPLNTALTLAAAAITRRKTRRASTR